MFKRFFNNNSKGGELSKDKKIPTFIKIPGMVAAYNVNHIKEFDTKLIDDYYQLWMKLKSGKRMCILNVDANDNGKRYIDFNKRKIESKIKSLKEKMEEEDETTISPETR